MKIYRPYITDNETNLVPQASGTLQVGTAEFAWGAGVFDDLQINNTPTTPLAAANKAYVDAQISGENFWQRAGTGVSLENAGDDVVPNASGTEGLGTAAKRWGSFYGDNAYINDLYLTGTSLHVGAITLSDQNGALNVDHPIVASAPTADNHLTTKQYVDQAVETHDTFIELTDTPAAYAGFAASGVRVNAGADGLEFYATAGAEADTLQTVTDRGASTTQRISSAGVTSSEHILVSASGSINLGSVENAVGALYADVVNLKADPTTELQAATKQYVDAAASTANVGDRNVIYVKPDGEEVTGKVYLTIAAALAYIATQSPATDNRWTVYFTGENSENFALPSWVQIQGDTYSSVLLGTIASAGTPTAIDEYAIADCDIRDLQLGSGNGALITRCFVRGGSFSGCVIYSFHSTYNTVDLSLLAEPSALIGCNFYTSVTLPLSPLVHHGVVFNVGAYNVLLGGIFAQTTFDSNGFGGTATLTNDLRLIDCDFRGGDSPEMSITIPSGFTVDVYGGTLTNVTFIVQSGGTLNTYGTKCNVTNNGTWNNYGNIYDNSTSGLTASDIQGAIDELEQKISAEDLWDRSGTILSPSTAGDGVKVTNGSYDARLVDTAGTRTAWFSDGTRTVELAGSTYGAGYFDDGSRSVAIGDGTNAILIAGGPISVSASGTVSIGSVSNAFNNAYIDQVYLKADPTLPLEAATKQYVDSQVAGVNEFTELTDTPSDYVGMAASGVRVNAIADGLEFYDATAPRSGHVHTQSVASTSWVVTHNLNNTNVIVQVTDGDSPENMITPQNIELTNANTTTITFPTAQSGVARIISLVLA